MQAFYEQLLILVSTPFYVVIIGLEVLLSNYHHRKLYSWRDTATNVYLMLLNTTDVLFRGFYIALLAYCYQHRYLEWHAVMYWALLLLAEDFLYYWLSLRSRDSLFWAVHVTHHSSDHLNSPWGFDHRSFSPYTAHLFHTVSHSWF
jgi:hypothetical protein